LFCVVRPPEDDYRLPTSSQHGIVASLRLTEPQLDVPELMMQRKGNEETCHELSLSEPMIKNLTAAILKALKKFWRTASKPR